MTEQTDLHKEIFSELDQADIMLCGLCAIVELMAMGCDEKMANGDIISNALLHVPNTIQDVRAKLDEASCSLTQRGIAP